MDGYGFGERDERDVAGLRYVPLVAVLSCMWFAAATVLYPVVALISDLRRTGHGRD